jgi:hypothetical protein
MGKVMAKVGALLLCGSLAAILAPGCTITIGPGTGEDEPLRLWVIQPSPTIQAQRTVKC